VAAQTLQVAGAVLRGDDKATRIQSAHALRGTQRGPTLYQRRHPRRGVAVRSARDGVARLWDPWGGRTALARVPYSTRWLGVPRRASKNCPDGSSDATIDKARSTMPNDALQATRSEVRGPLREVVPPGSHRRDSPAGAAATRCSADRCGHAPLRVCVCRVQWRDARPWNRAAVLRLCLACAGEGHGRAERRVQAVSSPPNVIFAAGNTAKRLAAHALGEARPTAAPRWQRAAFKTRSQRPCRATRREGQAYRGRRRACWPPQGSVRDRHMFGRTRFWGRGGAEQPAGGGASVAASASPAAWSEQPAPAASSLPELTPRQSVSTATRDDLAPSGGDPGAARAAEDVAPSPPPSCSCPGGHLGLLHLPSTSGLPLFPLLPREELLSPEELAIKFQGYGQYGCVCTLIRERVAPPKRVFPCRMPAPHTPPNTPACGPPTTGASTTTAGRVSSQLVAHSRCGVPPPLLVVPAFTFTPKATRARDWASGKAHTVATATHMSVSVPWPQTPVWCRHCHDEALEAQSAVTRTATRC
jgi:hypothetical protein